MELSTKTVRTLPREDLLKLIGSQNVDVLAAQKHYCERRLRNFIEFAWPVKNPHIPFSRGAWWYVDAIAEHLEALFRADIKNLLINLPGRMGKSLECSVFFPAWIWTIAPETPMLFASYAAKWANRDSRFTRLVIQSPWYQSLWGEKYALTEWGGNYGLVYDQNQVSRFDNTEHGFRVALSVGQGTGEGGRIVAADDPHDVEKAESEPVRTRTIRWWDETMGDRLNEPSLGGYLITAHRTHAQDLSGHVIEQGGYTHLMLPMEHEPKRCSYTTVKPHKVRTGKEPESKDGKYCWDPRKKEGELMDPGRIGPVELKDIKRRMGSYAWPARLQQRPSLREGGMVKIDWFPRYRTPLDHYDQIVQSWDTANKKGQANAWSVGITIGRTPTRSDILHVFRERMDIPTTQRMVVSLASTPWGPVQALLIENAASGIGIIQHIQEETDLPVIPRNPVTDKITRMDVETPTIEAGNIWLPEVADWLPTFETEMRDFPGSAYLDQADALSQYLAWLREQGGGVDWDIY